jgi:agmatine/peptidylarginine deiminase
MRYFLVTVVFVLLTILSAAAQEYDDYGNPILPRGIAPQEEGASYSFPRYLTDPPAQPVRAIAEWEEVEAIMVRWPANATYNLLWSQFLAPVALDVRIYVICQSPTDTTNARSYFLSHGVPVDSMVFQIRTTDSFWIRDYGPWWVWQQTSWNRAIVDWIYNRPARPNDNTVPEWQAAIWGIPYYGPNLIFTGGNFMVDGWGRGFCSELVFDENIPNVDTRAELDSVLGAFMNLDTVYTFPRFFGIDHIDMSMKLLNDHTCILNRYPVGDPYNAVMDSCEEILSQIQNPWGQNVQVVRINTPSWGSGTAYTYTNAIFVNNKVLVPIYNRVEDAPALAVWDSLLPGYSIFGFNCNSIIGLQGAIHCVVKDVIHRDLIRIEYPPLPDVLANAPGAVINARVVSLGTLSTDSLQLFHATNPHGPWQTVTFASVGNDHYEATIPPHPTGVPVYYYVRAKNTEGNWTSMPRYGPEAHYTTSFPQAPPSPPQGLTAMSSGDDVILHWNAVTEDIYGFPVGGVTFNIYGAAQPDNIINPQNLLATATDTTYTVLGVIPNQPLQFYQVVSQLP